MSSFVSLRTPGRLTPVTAAIWGALACLCASAAAQPPRPVAQMEEVVVTASGYEQSVADAPASITVITKEQLEGRYYRDVTDALQDVPGVSIEGGSGGKIESTSINIRGLGEDYVLFLVDGKPLGASSEAYYNGFGGAAQVGWLPPMSAIERIEVIRGPMSSLYGSSALGGVINVITKPISDQWTGSVTADTVIQEDSDAGATYQGRYYLSGPLIANRLGLTLYGSKFRRDEDDFIGGYAGKDRIDNAARLNWKLSDEHALSFEAGVSRHDNERTEDTGAPGDMENKRTNTGVTHDWLWGAGMQTRTYAIHEKVEIENGTNESSYQSSILNTRTILPLASHIITLGGEYKQEETDHDASRFPGSRSLNLERWQTALFVEDEYAMTDDFSLTGGLRFDHNEHYGSEVTPRLYGVYHLAPSLSLKGGVSGGYKTPTLKQADDNIVEQAARGAAWDMGNSDLKPERSTNYELGLAWSTPGGLNAGLMVYHTRYRDKIDRTEICTSPASAPACEYNGQVRQRINQYVNLDSATLQGVEASFGLPLGAARLNTSYTYSDSEITSGEDKGKPLNNLPRHMLNLGADYRVDDSLSLWGKLRFKSKTIDTGEEQIPSYTLVDIGANYRFNRSLSAFAGLYNLFDKEVDSEDYGKTLDGRRLYVGMTAEF